MKLPYMTDQCEQMLKISNEFVRLQVSYDEYLCMKVLLLLSTGEPHAGGDGHTVIRACRVQEEQILGRETIGDRRPWSLS